jgi:tryptophan-rich sensory protein
MFRIEYLLIIIPLIIGFLIGSNTKPDNWYFKLKKPAFSPPPYIFGIFWSILYLLIGISYYLAFKSGTNKLAFWIIPILHLLINFSFSPVLFGAKKLLESAVIVSLTLIFALLTMKKFYKVNKYSYYLLIPYICWLVFANYLGWTTYLVNK